MGSKDFVPTKVFLTNGRGTHKDLLQSFELALRDAGIEKCNLVKVSSIYPPGCKYISKEEGLKRLKAGQITHCVLSEASTNEPSRLIVASIGLAIPTDKTRYGYISEHHAFGQTDELAKDYAEDLAASMLASTLGIQFDSDKSWDEREKEYKMSGMIIKTHSVAQSIQGTKDSRLWDTAIAAAVFLFDEDNNN